MRRGTWQRSIRKYDFMGWQCGMTASSADDAPSIFNASNYFSGQGITAESELVYDNTRNVLYLQGVKLVPEPATTTLSLLALAALAARRKRK